MRQVSCLLSPSLCLCCCLRLESWLCLQAKRHAVSQHTYPITCPLEALASMNSSLLAKVPHASGLFDCGLPTVRNMNVTMHVLHGMQRLCMHILKERRFAQAVTHSVTVCLRKPYMHGSAFTSRDQESFQAKAKGVSQALCRFGRCRQGCGL